MGCDGKLKRARTRQNDDYFLPSTRGRTSLESKGKNNLWRTKKMAKNVQGGGLSSLERERQARLYTPEKQNSQHIILDTTLPNPDYCLISTTNIVFSALKQ